MFQLQTQENHILKFPGAVETCVSLTWFVIMCVFVLQNLTRQSTTVWQKSSKSTQTISLLGSEGSVDGNDWRRHLVYIHQCSLTNSTNSKAKQCANPSTEKISGFINNNNLRKCGASAVLDWGREAVGSVSFSY